MKTKKLYFVLVNWDSLKCTELTIDLQLPALKYYETREGCDILGYFEGCRREQGYRVYCFTTKKQARSLIDSCINQERKKIK